MDDRRRDDDRYRDARDRDRERDLDWRLRDERDDDRRRREDAYGRDWRNDDDRARTDRGFGHDGRRREPVWEQDHDARRFGRDAGPDRDFGGDRGWRAEDRDPGYRRNDYRPAERSPWDRSRDEVRSWFGDEHAMRRRYQDEIRDRERHPERRRDDDGRPRDRLAYEREDDRERREAVRHDADRREADRWRDDRWRRDMADRWERDWRGSNRDW